MTRVTARNLTKVFGDPEGDGVVAVDDVSLEVPDGELLVILGPSGCGKTTTLRIIGGLETPTSGTVAFDDEGMNDIPARNRDVAMVFQDFALYPHMSVRGNLGFGLKREANDLSADQIDQRVEEVAEMLEIEELLNKRPAELSGGQKQRVALGRSIVREPRVFLFDEPLANLDAKLRKTMRTEIEELQNQVGITSLYVTHNQEEAMTMADRIAIMNEGRLQQVGTPDETFNRPANVFVASFIGSPSINLFEGTVERVDGTYQLDLEGDTRFSISTDLVDEELVPGAAVTVGFRPQDIREVSQSAEEHATVDSEVRVVEPLGTEAIVHTQAAGGDVTAKMNRYQHLNHGMLVTLGIDPHHLYLFDESGQLIKPRQSPEGEARAETEEIQR